VIIDTSALLAILFDEPEATRLVQAIAAAPTRSVGAPTLVEAAAVMLAKKGPAGEIALDALLQRLTIEVIPMSVDAAVLARRAYHQFGKGMGSPGVLNYGDCLAYGIARAAEAPLLYKGSDLSATDVVGVVY